MQRLKSICKIGLMLTGCFGPITASAAGMGHGTGHHGNGAHAQQPYGGQEQRRIKALSADDIRQLHNGEGWGLAKSAELNGMPGPVHLLEHADAIGLTARQRSAIENLFAAMKAEAIPLGKKLVDLEHQLDKAFASRSVTEVGLRTLLQALEKSRAALRYTHLVTHLRTLPLLSEKQIATYNRLRGYAPRHMVK